MAGGVYLVRDEGELVKMTERPYDSEDVLQELIARYPLSTRHPVKDWTAKTA